MTRLSYSVPEAAEVVGVTPAIIRAAIKDGHLRAKHQSRNDRGEGVGKFLIRHADLEAWLEQLADA